MQTFKRLLITLVVLALIGAVGFLLSELNARTFSFERVEGNLVIKKGRRFVVGSAPFRPSDPAMVDAYAPIPVGTHDVSTLLEERYREREELDRALFQLLEQLARPKMESDDPKTLDEGLYLLRRAEKLTGITEEQRLSLKKMQADVAYYQARNKFDDARRLVVEALAQLKLASEAENRHSRNAHQMIAAIEPLANQLTEALRVAVHVQSQPASSSTEERPPEAEAVPAPAPGTVQPEPTPRP